MEVQHNGIIKRGREGPKHRHHGIAHRLYLPAAVSSQQRVAVLKMREANRVHSLVAEFHAKHRRADDVGVDDDQCYPIIARPFDQAARAVKAFFDLHHALPRGGGSSSEPWNRSAHTCVPVSASISCPVIRTRPPALRTEPPST